MFVSNLKHFRAFTQHNVIIKNMNVAINFVIFTVKITEFEDIKLYSKDKLQYFTVENVNKKNQIYQSTLQNVGRSTSNKNLINNGLKKGIQIFFDFSVHPNASTWWVQIFVLLRRSH
jgi:hypothetical protein